LFKSFYFHPLDLFLYNPVQQLARSSPAANQHLSHGPARPFRPALPPPARFASPAPAADDRWGPPVIPFLAPCPGRTRGRVRPTAARPPACLARTSRTAPSTYLSRAAPPGTPTRTLTDAFSCAALRRNPSPRRHSRSSSLLPRRRREADPELRLEVRRMLVPLVFEPEPCVDRARSMELRRHAAPPHRIVCRRRRFLGTRAALDVVPVARATSRCKEHSKSSPLARN
jgi:hypothetical protein